MDASNMDVTIDHIAKDGGKHKAFATVTFDGMFRVHGIRLAESKQGLNIFMPQRTFEKNGIDFVDIVCLFIGSETCKLYLFRSRIAF